MERTEAVRALRRSVAMSRMDHVHCLRLEGEEVFEGLDRVVAADLYLRDGQMIQSLLLDESGQVFADIYLGSDNEGFFLLAEGPSDADLETYLRRHCHPHDVAVRNLNPTHALVTLNGPYAWELLALLAGPDVVGLPYLTFFHFDRGLCFRAGKTGEYGYGVLLDRADLDAWWAQALELGADLDVAAAGLEALDLCALENWHFNIRREGREPITPVELQLQWRMSPQKEYLGSEALARRRGEGLRSRLTCLVSPEAIAAGNEVLLEGKAVGRVVNAGYSETREDWVAQALLDIEIAYPGIDAFRVASAGGAVPARSASPPLLNNLSLFLSPQIHSYAARHEFTFPPLARG